jgi:hypothetical protein
MILETIDATLEELADLLKQLLVEDYNNPCAGLSNSSIGGHTRHIIEMFQCLDRQYYTGNINYDLRPRDMKIQSDPRIAMEAIFALKTRLRKDNKPLCLIQQFNGVAIEIATNYHRELLYNLEHCIHHQALIKVALLQNGSMKISDDFGVARSTIEYRKQCVQ